MKHSLLAAALVLSPLIGLASLAGASTRSDGTSSPEIRQAEVEQAEIQQALAPFQTLLSRLPPALQERFLAHAHAWVALAPEEQAKLRENLAAWDDVPPLEKLRVRERFEAWEHMDAATRRSVLNTARGYAQLPENLRSAWRERFDALPPEQRQRYLFDPSTRSAMDLADALFPFVPAQEHSDTLAMLRNLSNEQVQALRRHLARLPPAQRNAYRQHLLSLQPAERASELAGH